MSVFDGLAKRFGYVKTGTGNRGENEYREESRVAGADFYGYHEDQEKPENDEDYLRAFQAHAILFSAINIKAQNSASPPLKVYKKDAAGIRVEITSGWPVDILTRPNRYMPGFRFRYGLSAYLSLTGDAFIEKDHKTEPHHLWLLQPTNMDIEKDPVRKVRGYNYDVNGSRTWFEPEEIIHLDAFNPLSEYFGQSSVSAITPTLTLDFYVQAFEQAFFRNGGHIGMHFSSSKECDKTVFDRLNAVIKQTFAGSGKNHKVLFTSHDVKVNKLTVDPKEADLTALRNYNIREILAALGVPRMLIMDSEETAYANAEAQLRVFWEQSVMPHNQSIQDYLNMGIYYPNAMECEFDYSKIAALQENKRAIIDLGVAACTGTAPILTVNEFRQEYLKKGSVPWGDEPAKIAVPPGFPLLPGRPGPETEPVTPTGLPRIALGVDTMKKILTVNEIREQAGLPPVPWGAQRISELAAKPEEEVSTKKSLAIAKAAEETLKSLHREWEQKLFKTIAEYFEDQAEIMDANLREWEKKHPLEKSALSYQTLANLSSKQKGLIDKILKLSNDMGLDFYRHNYGIYGEGKRPAEWLTEDRKKYLEKAVRHFAEEIDKTTLDQLRGEIAAAEDANESIRQIQDRVKNLFADTVRGEDSRAFMIARTEAGKVENYASLQSFQDLGAARKEWIAAGPPGDRPEHTAMNGETVGINAKFSNGLRYPGDPAGSPDEIINCRCTIAPVFD